MQMPTFCVATLASTKPKMKLPITLYLHLRKYHQQLDALEAEPTLSNRQRAARLGLPTTSYTKLLATYRSIPKQAWDAASRGNWRHVEEAVFGTKWGDLRFYPSYRKALLVPDLRPAVTRMRKLRRRRTKPQPPSAAATCFLSRFASGILRFFR